ncbi:Rieske 2Fe-2S domain-containing protein [Streptomyces tropicalis]|uniref:Rieske (2Fe-2S) protein n=1 Tax=Streptomyces tropicalis TaxID=3034234 RepID=A0ABT6A2N1_9ACTN|nr:Rieske (2Fe-2S) protein [Streptomyces tropicalis]MDF3298894.1 Rieske (2Fe-2S) protein [Streptomyces tropicalis]
MDVSRPRSRKPAAALDVLDEQAWLDSTADAARRVVRALPLGAGRDVLHGVWLGHPVHPALVQLPIGAWTAAGVLDLLPGHGRAAALFVGLGLASAAPAALAGWVDWAEQRPRQARTGLVHAAANLAAVVTYEGSLVARLRGRPLLGRLLGFGGLALATAGGVVGGHLAYRQAAGSNHAEAVPVVASQEWCPVGPDGDFPVGVPVRRMAGEVPVVLVRQDDGEVYALADRCSHLDGPLHQGEIEDGCIVCPWHGSRFRLADGENIAGPATAPQPHFESRIRGDGQVEVRMASG